MDAANALILNNKNQKHKDLWTENKVGTRVNIFGAFDDRREAEYIVNTICTLMDDNDYSYKDFAILYRANYQSRVIEDALLRARMPYIILGGISFYQRMEIKDILAYLKIIVNPSDGVALRRIINVPRRGIGNATVDKLDIYAGEHGMSLLEAAYNVDNIADIKTRGANAVKQFTELYDKIIEHSKTHSVVDTLEYILTESQYRRVLTESGLDENLDRLDNLAEMYNVITNYFDDNPKATLQDFLQEISLISEVDTLDENSDVIKLMTVHSSKGLEFPIVFVTGLEEGIFPHFRSMAIPNDIDEERRLCYVALTRAKKMLYTSFSEQRMIHGNIIEVDPSRFLYEIPNELTEERGTLICRSGEPW